MSDQHSEIVPTDDMYWCFDSEALSRAADHGCLGEDVQTGNPLACVNCLVSPPGPRVHNHTPYRPVCAERTVDGQLRGACVNDDGSDR